MMCVTQASVSTLLTIVGLRNAPSMAGNGGLIRGQPRFPSSDSMRPVSSPQMYAAAPRVEVDVAVEAFAEDVLAGQIGRVEFVDRLLQNAVGVAVLVADVEVRRLRLDRVASEEDAFEHLVRILLHEDAVVEGTRLRLIRVDAEIDRPWVILRQERPLESAREAGTAATAQTGGLHDVDDLGRLHFVERFFERAVAAVGAIGREEGIRLLGDPAKQDGLEFRHRFHRVTGTIAESTGPPSRWSRHAHARRRS